MKAMMIRRLGAAVVLAVAPLAMSGCEDKEKQAEIERLTEDLDVANQNLRVAQSDYSKLEDEMEALEAALREEKDNASNFERDLKSAKRELERMEERVKREEERVAVVKKPSSKESREKVKNEVDEKLGVMAEIKGDQSKGSGFVVEADGKVWVYFAASDLAGNAKLEITQSGGGRLEKFGAFEVAADADLARLELLEPPEEKLVPGEPSELKSGAPLLGVSDVGVVTEGRSYEPKPDEIKADSRISKCLPGSPVFHGETGALLGVVTDSMEAGTRQLWQREGSYSRTQRVVYRLDREVEWNALPIATFLAEARVIADADRMTRLVSAFAAVRPSVQDVSLNGSTPGGPTKDIFEKNKSVSAVRSLYDLAEWMDEKKDRASEADIRKRLKGPFEEIARASGKNTRELAAKKFSTFHQTEAKQSLEWRKEAEDSLRKVLKEL